MEIVEIASGFVTNDHEAQKGTKSDTHRTYASTFDNGSDQPQLAALWMAFM